MSFFSLLIATAFFMAAPASAADLCAPLEHLRTRDIPQAKALYRSCKDANEVFDRANAELGLKAIFEHKDLQSYIPERNANRPGPSRAEREQALRWRDAVANNTRQNLGAMELLSRAEAEERALKDHSLVDPRRLVRLRAALDAQAKVTRKGENLFRLILLRTEKIHSAAQLESSLSHFYEAEPPIFRVPATLK